MRTRLASLIVVKQEPLTNEYLESEQNALIGQTNYNEVDAQFYGLSDRHRDILPSQSIGDLNNNNSNYAQQDEFIEDKKCTYSIDLPFILVSGELLVVGHHKHLSSCTYIHTEWCMWFSFRILNFTFFDFIIGFDTSVNTISIFKWLINTLSRSDATKYSNDNFLFSVRTSK